MSTMVKRGSPSLATAPRILVTGNDLLAGALAGALERYGFSTMHIASSKPEIERGLEWSPDLVLFDDRSFDEANGSASVQRLRRRGFQICVIEASNDPARRSAWLHAGASELVDRNEPFDQLLLTITRLLQVSLSPRPERRSPASLASTRAGLVHDSQLERFASLTEREQFVLAELLEGHCAEEISKTAYVSISTVRSQIKSILQKLGVNSQLAAVALARRAGWSLNRRRHTDPKPENARRRRAS
jgi:two-component system nitrate/nitrite response regulator NarL